MADKEEKVTVMEFDHDCRGENGYMEQMTFQFKCVRMPDGRTGCRCPSCATTFIYEKPSGS